MNYPVQAVSANAIGVVLLFSLLINCRKKFRSKGDSLKIFFAMILVNLIQCILEPVTIVLDGKLFDGAVPLLTGMNAILYFNNIGFAMLWVVYAEARMYNGMSLRRRVRLFRFIPGMLVMAGAVLNLFFPVFFRVSQDNVYSRTELFPLTYGITYAYLIWGTVIAYGIGGRRNRYVFLPAITFLLPVFAVSIAQYLLPGTSLLWVGTAIGLNAAYISMLDERSYIDNLSDVFSRHYLNQYLSAIPRQPHGDLAGIMLDIDKFKSINDQFGHLVGDEAIRDVGMMLRRAAADSAMVFRFAGDEFVILAVVTSEKEIDRLCTRVRAEAARFNAAHEKPFEISFSMGYTMYSPGEKTSDFIKRMDDAMYADKNQK